MKKILLINPPRNLRNPKKQFTAPPLGLAYLASFLRTHGYEVCIIDAIIEAVDNCVETQQGVFRCGLGNDELKARIEQFSPDIVGISCIFTSRFNNVVTISKLVKQIRKDIIVVVGGMHVSCATHDVLSYDTIDFAVIGEGEIAFLGLVEALNRGSEEYKTMEGVCFRNKNAEIVINAQSKFVENLDSLPLPAWDLLPMEKYFTLGRDSLTKEKKHVSMITSRGCPYDCTFCSSAGFWQKRWRKRSSQNVLQEIDFLVNTYGIKEISFEDDNVSLDPQRLKEICTGMIQSRFAVQWNTPNGIAVHNLDRELISLMKQSGCSRLNFGIESGDEYILNTVIKKKLSLEKVKQVIAWCKKERICTLGYFILGIPGETGESVERTITFAKESGLDEIAVFVATPFPGTQLYNLCKEKGYLRKDYATIKAEDEIESTILFETPELSTDDLMRLKAKFYADFYKNKIFTNPLYCTQRVLRDPSVFFRFLKELITR